MLVAPVDIRHDHGHLHIIQISVHHQLWSQLMRSRIVAAAVLVLVMASPSVRAEALIQLLPADGEWVAFQTTVEANGKSESSIWTVKSVGKKEVAGVACRWIEMQLMNEERNLILIKCLIPESEFGKGKHPLGKAKQVFLKQGNRELAEFPSLAVAHPLVSVVLQGPGANAKKLDEKEAVEMQAGKIECDVISGTSEGDLGFVKATLTHRLLLTDKTAFGLAGAKVEITVTVNGKTETLKAEHSLKESGKDAKSALPDVQ